MILTIMKQKTTQLIFIVVLYLIPSSCSQKQTDEKRYPFQSGEIIYQNKVNEASVIQTLYFKEYGGIETIVTEVSMNNEDVVLTSIFKEDLCYTFSDKPGKVNETQIDRNKIDHIGLFTITPIMLEEANAIQEGTEILLDKTCEIYTIKNERYDIELWVWDNVIMKMITNYRGTEMIRTVIQIEETASFPSGIFEIP